MYREDIKEIKTQNRKASHYLLKDSIVVYIKLLFFFPMKKELRDQLKGLVKIYFQAQNDEKEILTLIKRELPYLKEVEKIEHILDELDEQFEMRYRYCDYYLGKYEALLEGGLKEVFIPENRFPSLNEDQMKVYQKTILDCKRQES